MIKYEISEVQARLLAQIIDGKELSEFHPYDQEIIYEMYLKFSKIVKS